MKESRTLPVTYLSLSQRYTSSSLFLFSIILKVLSQDEPLLAIIGPVGAGKVLYTLLSVIMSV